jgi:uncharacterized protein (TIGR00251 family)
VISDAPDGAIIDIKVIPRAGRTQLAGTRDNAILIRLAAAPVEGAANDALIAYLSDLLDIPKRNVIIVAGDKSRTKRIKVLGLSAAAIRARMAALGGK